MPTGLKVVICGAGIAGLASAVSLKRKGHHVLVLESYGKLSEVGSGLNIPANATRVLKHLGILERFEEAAAPPSNFVLRRWDNGAQLYSTATAVNRSPEGLPNWGMGRVDYQNGLYEAAVALGVEVRFGARVEDVDEDAPSVTLVGGEKISADLIVAADGIKSRLRARILADDDITPHIYPFAIYRATVPTAELAADPVTAPLVEKPWFTTWIGYQRFVVVYPIEGGRTYLIDGLHPADKKETGTWSHRADVAEIQRSFDGFDAPVRGALAHVRTAADWAMAEVPPLPRWTSGRVVLVGDAAHAMLPYLGQGAAMATEDAGALGECLGRVSNAEQIPAALRAFERTCKWRAERIQLKTRLSGDSWLLPDGQWQEWRDTRWAGAESALPPGVDLDLPFSDEEFTQWLYGYDVLKETNTVLDEEGL